MPKKQAYSSYPVKKTGSVQPNQRLSFEDRFESVSTTPLILESHEKISRRIGIQQLAKVLIRHSITWNKMVPSELQILRNYVQYYHEYYEFDQFDSSFEVLPSLDINLYTVSNEETIYKSWNIFKGLPWSIRFHNKFSSRVASFQSSQIKYILSFVHYLGEGNFIGQGALSKNAGNWGYVTPIECKTIPYNRFLVMKLFREKNLLIQVGVEKIPIVKSGVIKRYEFRNYIHFLDILSDQIGENPKKLGEAIDRFQEALNNDVAKRDHSDELILEDSKEHNKRNRDVTKSKMFTESINPYTGQREVFETPIDKNKHYLFVPLDFKPHYVSNSECSTLIFDQNMKRWVSNDYLTRLEKKALNEYQKKVNDEIIKRFVDFQSAKTLVQLLVKIPNFRVNLTEQEKDVIGENGNVLVIGRSGTGKTTCAVLRLFAIEMLFKIRLSLSKKKHQGELKDTRCSADDIDQEMGLHCIFLTASPVLTNEIQRYYKKLTDNIKDELEKKKQRVLNEKKRKMEQGMKKKGEVSEEKTEKVQEEFQELKPKESEVEGEGEEIVEKQSDDENLEVPEKIENKKSEQVLEEEEEMNKQLGSLQLQEKIENENFEEEEEDFDEMKEELESKMKKFQSLFDLQESDYPGFFTIKSFIMMVDGTLKKPFFIKKNNESSEEQSQATWHNERKGVMMIENYHRTEEQEKQEEKEMAEQIEEQINYSDEEELEHEYLRQIQLRENKEKQKLTDKLNKNKKNLSFEVDYNYFATYFWPTVKHKHFSARNITPHLVWTEIYSTIKGSASAHLYPGLYLPEKVYINESSNSFLTQNQKLDIFETYCQYERWKMRNGGYDMMDAVGYILNYIRFRGYDGPDLHYLMIDEVQDLPHCIVYLLSKIVQYGVFYSGDTAQTIAKGVGFRFCDLKNLFDKRQFDMSLKLTKPIVKQLTVNFRSHNNILQLANSIVSSLELLFPKTIDRLKKEISNLHGPKPMILAEGDEDLLFFVLCGDETYKNKKLGEENTTGMKKPPLQFGCDQVIIVRDQESKNRIPSSLQHALCLTIYEAKGLEFNDVILFNFFTESECADKWHLLKNLNVMTEVMNKKEYEKSITKHGDGKSKKEKKMTEGEKGEEGEGEEEEEEVDCMVDMQGEDSVLVKRITHDSKVMRKDINDYAELCSELKMLYTAVTRPKKTLIIYDDNSFARRSIERLWDRLGVVQMVSKEILQSKSSSETEQIKIFKTIINSTDESEWKKQGLRMYARGYFEQAMKCFQKSGHEDLYKKSKANSIADTATKKLIEIESEKNAIKNKLIQYQNMGTSELSKAKKKLKKDESVAFKSFEASAAIFNELLMFKQAGQCYFSGKQFNKAFECFSKAFMNKQAAQSLQMLNKYREAAEYYEKEGCYLKIIECLDMVNEWDQILKVIQRYSSKMSEVEKQSLFKKYSALALQELVYEIEFENEDDEKKPENNRVEVIQEEEDSQEEEDWDEDPEVAAEREFQRRSEEDSLSSRKMSEDSDFSAQRKLSSMSHEPSGRKESLVEEDKIIQESVYEQIEQKQEQKEKSIEQPNSFIESSFADLNESSSIMEKTQENKEIMQSIVDEKKENTESKDISQKKIEENEENSFAELNSEESSFAELNESDNLNIRYPSELQPDIESIKSLADPEDSWIRSALSEIQANTLTEYSVIDEEENYSTNVRIIKTRGNIFVQDEVMRKIVNIVSIINSTVSEFFKNFKGYQSLLTVNPSSQNDESIDNRPEISQFEDIDSSLINIILDTLESFKLYKLCLFVCNRYHLPHKAGRYLISMGLKYSTNAQVNNTLNSALISPSVNRKSELEKGILASIALHAILENVSSDFLKIKVRGADREEKNSLGAYFIEGLIIEGLYKKSVFIVNPEQSLKILQNFKDSTIYQQIFKQKFLKNTSPDSKPEFLPSPPKNDIESNYTIVKLEEILFAFDAVNKFQALSVRFFKEFSLQDYKTKLNQEPLPTYTPYLRALVTKDEEQIMKVMKENLGMGYKILEKGERYEIFDFVTFCTKLINTEWLFSSAFKLPHTEFLELYRCIRIIWLNLHKMNRPKSNEIIQAVLSVFGCRLIEPCKSTKFINDGFAFIHRTSVICNQFIEELKKNKDETAFFFEQDYNLIIVRSRVLLKFISKRMEFAYTKFIRFRANLKNKGEEKQIIPAYFHDDFLAEQTQGLIRMALHEEEKMIYLKKNKKPMNKDQNKKKVKKSRPNFNYKNQGRPELFVDFDEDSSSQDELEKFKESKTTKFIMPDLNPCLKYMNEILLQIFYERAHNSKHPIPGSILYCADLNDSYKEYVTKMKGYNLYDAIQFKKFNRLDLYCDNILSVIYDLTISEKHILSTEILILLLIQYKKVTMGNKFTIEIPKSFLKFLPGLKFVEAVDDPTVKEDMVKELIHKNSHSCVFSFANTYTSELAAEEIIDLMTEFLQILRIEQVSNVVNLPGLVILFLINMENCLNVFETLRHFINGAGHMWNNPIFQKMNKADNYEQFCDIRLSIMEDQTFLKNCILLHQIKVEDVSCLEKSIKDSEIDYDIKEKIMAGRKKAANRIGAWWKTMKRKSKTPDEEDIIMENRIVKCIHKDIKYLPSDDSFLVRSAAIRNVLLSFYLRHVVTSSLDFHFILMTLNRIEDARSKYLTAYENKGLMEDREFDFEEEISNIEKIVSVWKSDSKWLKERNMDLKRKKVFEVKWMTKNLIQSKIIKKRAGLKKNVKLQKKKEILKRR